MLPWALAHAVVAAAVLNPLPRPTRRTAQPSPSEFDGGELSLSGRSVRSAAGLMQPRRCTVPADRVLSRLERHAPSSPYVAQLVRSPNLSEMLANDAERRLLAQKR